MRHEEAQIICHNHSEQEVASLLLLDPKTDVWSPAICVVIMQAELVVNGLAYITNNRKKSHRMSVLNPSDHPFYRGKSPEMERGRMHWWRITQTEDY